MTGEHRVIPQLVIPRLTKYLTQVQSLRADGVEWISSHELADTLGLTSSTVRQDLSYLDFSGISKRGYETLGLERSLTDILGLNTAWKVVVVGAGNLGKALALHEEFPRRGFNICGIFDCDEKKVGKKIGRLVVECMGKLPGVIAKRKVEVGLIAVPGSAAQSVADLLISAGVKGVLNLALAHIAVPEHVVVVDARIVASLQELCHAIKVKKESQGE